MSFFLCPRAAGPLAGVTARAIRPRNATVPSIDALRWLSNSVSNSTRSPIISLYRSGTKASGRITTSRGHLSQRTFLTRVSIATEYQELPTEYQDHVGLKFRKKDLTQDEIDQIFGSNALGVEEGNALIRIMHGRRVAGTLEDPQYRENTELYTSFQIQEALAYLRAKLPVNETLNAGMRAEEELAELTGEAAKEEVIEEPKKKPSRFKAPSMYKPLPEEKPDEPEELEVDPTYGQSAFDRMRARNMKRSKLREAEMERLKKEREAKMEAEAAKAGPPALITESGKKIMSPKLAEYYKEAEDQGLQEPEFVPFWQRVLPSLTFVVAVVGFCAVLTSVYDEPEKRYRMFPEITASQATMGAIIGLNLLVWTAWRVPPLWKFFNKYMILVVGAVKPVTMVTSVFSHQSMGHLLLNMVPLWFVGVPLHDDIGRAAFLTLYLASGAFGYVCSLVTYTARGWLAVSSLGASGSLIASVAAYFYLHRWDGYTFFGLPENGVHGLAFLAIFAGYQLSLLGRTASAGLDVASHLGGLATGVIGAEIIERLRAKKNGESVEEHSEEVKQLRKQIEVLMTARPEEVEAVAPAQPEQNEPKA